MIDGTFCRTVSDYLGLGVPVAGLLSNFSLLRMEERDPASTLSECKVKATAPPSPALWGPLPQAAMLAWCETIIKPSLLTGRASGLNPFAAQRTCEEVASACQVLAPLRSNLRTATGTASSSSSRDASGNSSSSRTSNARPPPSSPDSRSNPSSSSQRQGNTSSSSWSRSGTSSGSSSAGAGSSSTGSGSSWSSSSSSSEPRAAGAGARSGEGAGGTGTGAESGGQGARAADTKASPGASRGRDRQVLLEEYNVVKEKRAREIKAMLVERGIDCSDCFEKEDLLKRLLRDCVVPGAP